MPPPGRQAATCHTRLDARKGVPADLDDYFDLGSYAREVTTSSAQARVWFNRGLVWAYGFNHEEAAACFERAIESDPGCALAYWGLAYALGPNYNKPWDDFDPADLASSVSRAFGALTDAARHTSGATPVERALVRRAGLALSGRRARRGPARPGAGATPTPCARL